MEGMVFKFDDGRVVDLRSWPVKVLGTDGAWRLATDADGTGADIKDAVVLAPETVAKIDAKTERLNKAASNNNSSKASPNFGQLILEGQKEYKDKNLPFPD